MKFHEFNKAEIRILLKLQKHDLKKNFVSVISGTHLIFSKPITPPERIGYILIMRYLNYHRITIYAIPRVHNIICIAREFGHTQTCIIQLIHV